MRRFLSKNKSNAALTNCMSRVAINLALNWMIGSKPNKRYFKLWAAISNGIGALTHILARLTLMGSARFAGYLLFWFWNAANDLRAAVCM